MPKGAVFLDRDGVIVEDVNHLSRADQLALVPGSAAAIRRLNERAIPVVIITNQSVVARGLVSEEELKTIHEALFRLLEREGARIDGLYYCPHHPEVGVLPYRAPCSCRKPEPGLFLRAADDLDLALERSVMIGDSLHDLDAGRRAGCKLNVLVLTGHGREERAKLDGGSSPDFIADDLSRAVAWILDRPLSVRA
jgi:D-glycero-D-manno-heptose 1,7-bisphosphate phosphatase